MMMSWLNSKQGFIIIFFFWVCRDTKAVANNKRRLQKYSFSVVKECNLSIKRQHGKNFLCWFPVVKVKLWSLQYPSFDRPLHSFWFTSTHPHAWYTPHDLIIFLYPPTYSVTLCRCWRCLIHVNHSLCTETRLTDCILLVNRNLHKYTNLKSNVSLALSFTT